MPSNSFSNSIIQGGAKMTELYPSIIAQFISFVPAALVGFAHGLTSVRKQVFQDLGILHMGVCTDEFHNYL